MMSVNTALRERALADEYVFGQIGTTTDSKLLELNPDLQVASIEGSTYHCVPVSKLTRILNMLGSTDDKINAISQRLRYPTIRLKLLTHYDESVDGGRQMAARARSAKRLRVIRLEPSSQLDNVVVTIVA